MECALREVRDEDLAVLFEQWADPAGVARIARVARIGFVSECMNHRSANLLDDHGAAFISEMAPQSHPTSRSYTCSRA